MKTKFIFFPLLVLSGLVFLYSGYTKLDPVEPFEFRFVELKIANWQIAPFLARLIIGVEFLIDILLVINIHLKKYSYKLAISVLVFFSIYLIWSIANFGNENDCGCFGDYIQMTPLQALTKNIIMIALLVLSAKFYTGWIVKEKYYKIIVSLTVLLSLSLPYILNPIELDYSEAYLNKPENNFKLELDSLYKDADINVPPKTLSKGKHIIAFMSTTCSYCRTAAKKVHLIHGRKPSIPFYIVLIGENKNVDSFFEETNAKDVPYCRLNNKNFFYLAGTSLPAIYLVNNSVVEGSLNYFNLNESEIEEWLQRE